MDQEIKTILANFGFSETEVEVYLAALALKRPTVTEIAKKIGKGRTAVYFHIRNLQEKGLLFESKKAGKQIYTALPPGELFNKMNNWTKDFQILVPELELLQKVEQETPNIELSESKLGYWKIYDEISSMPKDSEYRDLQGKKSLEQELQLFSEGRWDSFFTKITKKNIGTIGIFTKEALTVPEKKLNKKNLAQMRSRRWNLKTLPENILDTQQLMFLYNNKVAFLFPE